MPEIWLNYGNNDVVLDILAENLEERPVFESNNLDDSKINEKLESLDLSKPIEIALLNYTDSTQTILSKIYEKCEAKSISKPKLLVDKRILSLVKSRNPEEVFICIKYLILIREWFKESQSLIPEYIDETIYYLGSSYAFIWQNIKQDIFFNGNYSSENKEFDQYLKRNGSVSYTHLTLPTIIIV